VHDLPCGRSQRICQAGAAVNGVVGRAWATRPNYAYSPGLVAGHQAGRTWDEATLDQWLTAPQKLVPNTKRFFGGLPDQQKRQAVIAYLEQFDQNGQKKP
jgi:cytochrome c